jgi:hypothetical protein
MYSATVDCPAWPWRGCLMCFGHLISIVLDVWPIYTLPHSHGMQYTRDVFRPRSSLISLKVLTVFSLKCDYYFFTVCLANSLLSMLDVKCWYRSMATPTCCSVAVQNCCWCIGVLDVPTARAIVFEKFPLGVFHPVGSLHQICFIHSGWEWRELPFFMPDDAVIPHVDR